MSGSDTMHGSERLIAVVGPSGAGKDSVLDAWRRRLDAAAPVHFARRTITRPVDAGGEDHEACDEANFASLEAAGALAITWRANGLCYGVRISELAPLDGDGWVVLNMSREWLPSLRRRAPGLKVVLLQAPAEVLRARLLRRGRESASVVEARVTRQLPPVDAHLVLVNVDQPIDVLVNELHRWWLAMRASTPRSHSTSGNPP